MRHPDPPPSPEAMRWLAQIFSAQAAARGEVVRRSVRDVERLIGREIFLREIHRRGFGLAENAGQFVIFCNHEPVTLLASPEPPQIPSRKGFAKALCKAFAPRPVRRRKSLEARDLQIPCHKEFAPAVSSRRPGRYAA